MYEYVLCGYDDAHWRGSVWKAVWKGLLLWLIFFFGIKFVFEYALSSSQQEYAKKVVNLFASFTSQVPLHFLLGFYVGLVLTRWWSQINYVPFPEDSVTWICALVPENDRKSKLITHTVARYLVLAETLALRMVSSKIRKRFATLQCLVGCNLMTKDELELYEYNERRCPHIGWQLPLQWAISGVMVPLGEREINPISVGVMGQAINLINKFRENLRQLFIYDWICIPLVYTQTVSVVVYGYFVMCCIGHQTLATPSHDIRVPFLTILQFVFYVGWLNVAQDLMRPFGDDDDDVELNYLLDRNFSVAITTTSYCSVNSPPLQVDPYFTRMEKAAGGGADIPTLPLPYTKLSLHKGRDRPPKLLAKVEVKKPETQLEMVYKGPPTISGSISAGTSSQSPVDPTRNAQCGRFTTAYFIERSISSKTKKRVFF